MRNLAIKADANGDFPTWCRVPSGYVNSFTLTAGVAVVATVPALAGKVFFSCNADFYVKHNGVGAVPGNITNGSACEMNPSCYIVTPGDTLGIITEANSTMTLTYYR